MFCENLQVTFTITYQKGDFDKLCGLVRKPEHNEIMSSDKQSI